MREIFLGKAWHWAVLVVTFCALWGGGESKLHVTTFNPFVLCLLIGSALIVLLFVKTTKPDEQITRDPLPSPEDAAETIDAQD